MGMYRVAIVYASREFGFIGSKSEHNDSEEQKDLPELEPHLGADGSATAAQSFSQTKKFVPTRSVLDSCRTITAR